MEFTNPILLWGGLAIAIPIIIHFWHKKKGKLLEWAAMQWLSEKTKQQARGLKLENILLLALRILSILLLVILLSKPIIKPLFGGKNNTKILFVYPKKEVVENFKFELEEATKKKQKIYWLSGEKVKSYEDVPTFTHLNIQKGINKITENLKGGEKAEIYTTNDGEAYSFNKVFVPVEYNLHFVENKENLKTPPIYKIDSLNYLSLNNNGELFVDNANLEEKPIGSGPISVLMEVKSEPLKASLKAISDVYRLEFDIDTIRNKTYDLVFTNKSPNKADQLTFILNKNSEPEDKLVYSSKVIYLNEGLSEIESGRLPEIILENWANVNSIRNNSENLSIKQVKQKFELFEQKHATNTKWFSNIILVSLLVVIGAERWIALHKNA